MVILSYKLSSYLKLLRLWQWLKNLLIIAPIILSDSLNFDGLVSAIILFFIFSLFVSANYILNDLSDISLDKNHPEKMYRPIASGEISKFQAIIVSLFLFIITTVTTYLYYEIEIVFLFFVYLSLALLYTKFLKFINFIDSIVISTLFLLRLLIGGVATNVEITIYLYTFTFFMSMFIVYLKKNSILNKKISSDNLFRETLFKQNNKFYFQNILYFLGILVNISLVLWGASLSDNLSSNKLFSIIGFIFIFIIITFRLIKNSSNGDLEDFVLGIFHDKISLILIFIVSVLFIYFYF